MKFAVLPIAAAWFDGCVVMTGGADLADRLLLRQPLLQDRVLVVADDLGQFEVLRHRLLPLLFESAAALRPLPPRSFELP